MIDHDSARELLELEERATPFCECGAPTLPVAHGGDLWLECSSLGRTKPLVRRLLPPDGATWHTRRLILAAGELSAADGPHRGRGGGRPAR
jgi:hypothetical protein